MKFIYSIISLVFIVGCSEDKSPTKTTVSNLSEIIIGKWDVSQDDSSLYRRKHFKADGTCENWWEYEDGLVVNWVNTWNLNRNILTEVGITYGADGFMDAGTESDVHTGRLGATSEDMVIYEKAVEGIWVHFYTWHRVNLLEVNLNTTATQATSKPTVGKDRK